MSENNSLLFFGDMQSFQSKFTFDHSHPTWCFDSWKLSCPVFLLNTGMGKALQAVFSRSRLQTAERYQGASCAFASWWRFFSFRLYKVGPNPKKQLWLEWRLYARLPIFNGYIAPFKGVLNGIIAPFIIGDRGPHLVWQGFWMGFFYPVVTKDSNN